MKYEIKPTHISQISVGDTIKCRDGVIRTVCKSNIHYLQGIGTTIFGDSYNLGTIPVDKVIIIRAI
jgi:hypothetical protein